MRSPASSPTGGPSSASRWWSRSVPGSRRSGTCSTCRSVGFDQGPRRQDARRHSDLALLVPGRRRHRCRPGPAKAQRRRHAARHPRRHRRAAPFRRRRIAHHRGALGHLLQAGFPFRRRPGRRHAIRGQDAGRRRGDRSLRPGIAGIHRRRRFRPYVVLGARLLPGTLLRPDRQVPEGTLRRPGLLHPGQFSGVRQVLRERLRHRRQQSRLQDDRRGPPGGRRNDGRDKQPLLEPFRFSRYAEGRLHPTSNSPFPWS